MKLPFPPNSDLLERLRSLPAVDPNAIRQTIAGALASAGIATDSPAMTRMFGTIDQAMTGGPFAQGIDAAAAFARGRQASANDDDTIDVEAVEVGGRTARLPESGPAAGSANGQFTTHTFESRAGSRRYRLYVPAMPDVPADAPAQRPPMPAIVMLHGCTQNPDDFATGTQMNRLADLHGFVVIYPEQTSAANPSACWNWFRPQDQGRGKGEPAILAGIVDDVARLQTIDRRRVFVAGLSAGAAMAVVLAHTYPDVFSGVGVHSGLAYKVAHDVPSAMMAMNALAAIPGQAAQGGTAAAPSAAVPTIIFHGDADKTVAPANGARVLERTRSAWGARITPASESPPGLANGRRFTRQRFVDDDARVVVESWTIHGAGHAWSGGSRRGSFADDKGPDASAEMVRFFLALQS